MNKRKPNRVVGVVKEAQSQARQCAEVFARHQKELRDDIKCEIQHRLLTLKALLAHEESATKGLVYDQKFALLLFQLLPALEESYVVIALLTDVVAARNAVLTALLLRQNLAQHIFTMLKTHNRDVVYTCVLLLRELVVVQRALQLQTPQRAVLEALLKRKPPPEYQAFNLFVANIVREILQI